MTHRVKIADGKHNVELPDGGHYNAGDEVTLTDDQFAEISPTALGDEVIDVTPAPAGGGGATPNKNGALAEAVNKTVTGTLHVTWDANLITDPNVTMNADNQTLNVTSDGIYACFLKTIWNHRANQDGYRRSMIVGVVAGTDNGSAPFISQASDECSAADTTSGSCFNTVFVVGYLAAGDGVKVDLFENDSGGAGSVAFEVILSLSKLF